MKNLWKFSSSIYFSGSLKRYYIMTKFTVKSLKYLLPPLNILECQRPLGVANGAITELQITASTEYNSELAPMFGRLFYWSGWSTAVNDVSEWLQIDLGQKNVKVIGAATQGRHNSGQWVTTYKLQYSDEGVSFTYYKEEGQTSDKVKKTCKTYFLQSRFKIQVN